MGIFPFEGLGVAGLCKGLGRADAEGVRARKTGIRLGWSAIIRRWCCGRDNVSRGEADQAQTGVDNVAVMKRMRWAATEEEWLVDK